MRTQEQPKFDRLNRLEITIAEIMRINDPGTLTGENGELWLDIVDAMAKMLGSGKPRFDSNLFYERCFGEQWSSL